MWSQIHISAHIDSFPLFFPHDKWMFSLQTFQNQGCLNWAAIGRLSVEIKWTFTNAPLMTLLNIHSMREVLCAQEHQVLEGDRMDLMLLAWVATG